MKKLVSVITPTYNHEKFIGQCIESVQSQTYDNWEMIIIDDHSVDQTLEIAQRYTRLDKRIKIIQHKKNWGIQKLKATYNQALAMAQGNLIAILEGDDFWPKDKLEKQIKDFKKEGVYVLSFGNCAITDPLGRLIQVKKHKIKESVFNSLITLQLSIMSPTVMIKKSALLKINGFQNDADYQFVDIPTYLALASKGKFYYHQDLLGCYRKHENSSCFKAIKNDPTVGRKKAQQCILRFIQRNKGLNLKKIIREQNKIIQRKKLLRRLIILKHQLLFNKNNFAQIIKRVVSLPTLHQIKRVDC